MIDWDTAVLAPTNAVFGESVLYAPAAGGSFTISGVFDEAYRSVELIDGDIGVPSVGPVLGVRLAEFPAAPAQGDRLTILRTGIAYTVREPRPDGHGAAKLMLNVAPA